MGDLFGGNFNSADFYGLGADDQPWYDLSQYASKLPDFSSWANSVVAPVAALAPDKPAAPSADFDLNAWEAKFAPAFEAAKARDEARNAGLPMPSGTTSTALQPAQPVASPSRIATSVVVTPTRSAQPSSPSNFTQDFSAVVTGITSVLAPFTAARQQRAQATAAARGRAPASGASRSGGTSDMTTYLYIGGGVLLLAGLLFVVAKD